jgi:hypothetical protein
MIQIVYGMLIGAVAQAFVFIQLQGQFKVEWIKEHPFVMALIGVPISYMFINSSRLLVNAFDGQLWPSRLIGFGVGIAVYIIMSRLWFNEPITLKTFTCLLLSTAIILIQLFWK